MENLTFLEEVLGSVYISKQQDDVIFNYSFLLKEKSYLHSCLCSRSNLAYKFHPHKLRYQYCIYAYGTYWPACVFGRCRRSGQAFRCYGRILFRLSVCSDAYESAQGQKTKFSQVLCRHSSGGGTRRAFVRCFGDVSAQRL